MAGNIIPAIATTNAVISGLIVMEALKILSGCVHKCKTIFLNKHARVKKRLLVSSNLVPPNPKCYVCASKPEVTVHLNTNKMTVKMLEEKILKEKFAMVAPDVEIEDGKGTILISSEEGETEDNNSKMLSEFKIVNGTRLKVDDFLQNYELVITIRQREEKDPDELFVVEGEENLPTSASSASLKEIDVKPDRVDKMDTASDRASDRKRKLEDDEEQQSTSEKKGKLCDQDIIVL
eukprot:gene1360-15763_t